MSDPNAPQPEVPQTPPAAPGAAPVPPQQPYAPPPQQPQQPYPPQQPYAGAPAAPGAPLSPQSDQQTAMWAHLGGIVGILPSLIIWLVFKDRGPKANHEGKEALNWQITFLIIMIGIGIIFGIIAGILTGIAVSSLNPGLLGVASFIAVIPWFFWVINAILSIIGGVKVAGGGSYRYPLNFRFIK